MARHTAVSVAILYACNRVIAFYSTMRLVVMREVMLWTAG